MSHLLWLSIESVTLLNNAAIPGQNPGVATVLASLTYPRSGAPMVNSGRQYPLPCGTFTPDASDFFISGVFKEIVETETILNLKITDTDTESRSGKVLRAIVDAALGLEQSLAPYQMPVVLGVVAASGIGFAREGIDALMTEPVYIVAQAEPVRLRMSEISNDPNEPTRMALGLTVPKEIRKPYQVSGQNSPSWLTLPKGAPNGEIVLRLAAEKEQWTT